MQSIKGSNHFGAEMGARPPERQKLSEAHRSTWRAPEELFLELTRESRCEDTVPDGYVRGRSP
jgi:hypothetical protein